MEKLGFIGMGNMAKALATGFIKSGKMKGENVFAYAPHQDKLKENAKNIGFTPCPGLQEVVAAADTIIIHASPSR